MFVYFRNIKSYIKIYENIGLFTQRESNTKHMNLARLTYRLSYKGTNEGYFYNLNSLALFDSEKCGSFTLKNITKHTQETLKSQTHIIVIKSSFFLNTEPP